MQSKTLCSKGACFSRALFINDLTRFWPLWALYLAGWLLAMPVLQFIELFNRNSWADRADNIENALDEVLTIGGVFSTAVAVIAGCLFAMTLFSYLTTARSAGFAHALPVRREGLFITHFLAGCAVFLFTHLLTLGLTAAIWAAAGVRPMSVLSFWFLSITGQTFFFYCFSVFCAMFTGQILAMPVFYGIFNILAVGITQLIHAMGEMFFYGYSNWDLPEAVVWLTPALKLGKSLTRTYNYDTDGRRLPFSPGQVPGLGAVGVYVLAGGVLAALALAVYRRRRSESAGDTVAVGWARPAFRYGVGLCTALSLGQGLYALIWGQFSDGSQSTAAFAGCLVLTGLIGYYGAEMLLNKSFRVFRLGWKGAAALAAVLAALSIGCGTDVLGVQTRVPDAAQVKSLDFAISGCSGYSGTLTDPETIARFTKLHQAVVQKWEADNRHSDNSGDDSVSVRLAYKLSSGASVYRNYNLFYSAADLQNPDSPASLAAALLSSPTVQLADLPEQSTVERYTGGYLEYYNVSGSRYSQAGTDFDADTARTLLDAFYQDIKAGHAGLDQMDNAAWEQNTYVNTLTFYYRKTGDNSGRIYSTNVTFSTHYTDLLAALEQAGLIRDPSVLATYAQMNETGAESNGEKALAQAAAEIPAGTAGVSVIGGADGSTEIVIEKTAPAAGGQD